MFTHKTFVLPALVLLGCAGAPAGTQLDVEAASASAGAAATTTYVDVDEYTINQGDAPFEKWRSIYSTLAANFDDVCGDTFCEGDYSNLVPIRLRCTVNQANGVLKSCTYVFAGSYEDITPSTGTIRVNAKTFSCHLPVSGLELGDLMNGLTATGTTPALRRPLLSGGKSIYDSLAGCL